jgi:hypothetical protein
MKACPKCAFSNEERFPTCVWCNTSLADIPSIAPVNPADPEHERRTFVEQRSAIIRRQSLMSVIVYALAVTLLAAVPGMIFHPLILTIFFATALLVGASIHFGITGQFNSSILQGIISVVLLVFLAPFQPLIFFTLAGHIILPGFLWHTISMLHDANR